MDFANLTVQEVIFPIASLSEGFQVERYQAFNFFIFTCEIFEKHSKEGIEENAGYFYLASEKVKPLKKIG